jgi:hypothetical protein
MSSIGTSPYISQAGTACEIYASAATGCGGSFGALLAQLAQGSPFDAPKGSPEQAAVFRGASKPGGRIFHTRVKYAGC